MGWAIVAPYDGAAAVTALAEALEVADALPCVVFLGRRLPPQPGAAASVWHRLGAHPLALRPGEAGYPDALARIYRTVYGRGAIGGGTRLAAAFDRRLNAWLALKLVAGLVAPWLKQAIDGAEAVTPD